MKNSLYVAAAAAALMLLGACSTMPAGDTAMATAESTQSVYYDGFYGPLDSGHWGADGSFYYRNADGKYVRDYDGHVRTSPDVGYVQTRIKRGS